MSRQSSVMCGEPAAHSQAWLPPDRDMPMSTLLVGFDSAWTPGNRGALAGAFRSANGVLRGLGPPRTVNFPEAADILRTWQADLRPVRTFVLLDQPTIVENATGQRPVENIVSPSVGRRSGGMQPANTSRNEMFGPDAPVWRFLELFGGAADPRVPSAAGTQVFETYPVLTMIALGWSLPGSRAAGRLPKYNPDRRKTFSLLDWQYLCGRLAEPFRERGLTEIVDWLGAAGQKDPPGKRDQDGLDACLCLLVALYLAEGRDCLMVGDGQTGHILVPHGAELCGELESRCTSTKRAPAEWVHTVRLPPMDLL